MSLLSIGLALVVTLIPSTALPCGNAVILKTKQAAQLLVNAEKAIQDGDYKRAISSLERRSGLRYRYRQPAPDPDGMPRFMHEPGGYHLSDPSLQHRWDLLLAVAHLRANDAPMEKVERELLRLQDKRKSPYLQARLAEAQARLGKRAEALEALAKLEKADVMPDAEGYAALAELRNEKGDTEGRDRALERCRKMASKRPARAVPVCPSLGAASTT